MAAFGSSSTVHTDRILRLSLDLPIVVVVVEAEEKLRELLPVPDPRTAGRPRRPLRHPPPP